MEDDSHYDDSHDEGLRSDLPVLLLRRRRLLGLAGGLSVAGALAACGLGPDDPPPPSASPSASGSSIDTPQSAADATPVQEVPDETAGPFPGDGSNGPNVLDDTGIVRADIRSSFGTSTTVATGVPLTIRLTVRDAASGDALTEAAVYAWHCDSKGGYSIYGSGLEDENYLRGVQPVDESGTATFTSIFPGCYPGRWPHIHFEVYPSVSGAIDSGPIVKTSQIALPRDASEAVYATDGYGRSLANLSGLSLAGDGVFGDDGGIHQIATMSGSVAAGYTASLTIGV